MRVARFAAALGVALAAVLAGTGTAAAATPTKAATHEGWHRFDHNRHGHFFWDARRHHRHHHHRGHRFH
ncbi:hypothetical protein [Peterkaempfera sp. SMS 1(5)a]|uniref:hypothetical protein n=1 Tax=Peterkaempfera podocarpi TaxID=3232308 RepID=UPI0036733905